MSLEHEPPGCLASWQPGDYIGTLWKNFLLPRFDTALPEKAADESADLRFWPAAIIGGIYTVDAD